MTNDKAIDSLVYVARESLNELNDLMKDVGNADPRTITARLRQIESVSGTLSQSLKKLSEYMDSLPAEEQKRAMGPTPPDDADAKILLAAVQKFLVALDAAKEPDPLQPLTRPETKI
ncbi:MAG: hypothetical protein VX874_11605 [Pseudomonadota bacterium]|nr:hypothetical protein [Pseudomonadota bacterium]